MFPIPSQFPFITIYLFMPEKISSTKSLYAYVEFWSIILGGGGTKPPGNVFCISLMAL